VKRVVEERMEGKKERQIERAEFEGKGWTVAAFVLSVPLSFSLLLCLSDWLGLYFPVCLVQYNVSRRMAAAGSCLAGQQPDGGDADDAEFVK